MFKKSSPNGKITTYLGKRDFIDYCTHVDPIDGVVLVDPEYVKDRKVMVSVLAAFRYGREDLDVLGLTFCKDLYLATMQVYPPVDDSGGNGGAGGSAARPRTRLQERLLRKLGANAYPFYFELPQNAPASVTLQPGPEDTGKPCGVDYELKTYVTEADAVSGSSGDKAHKRSTVRLALRKLTYAPEGSAPQPSTETTRDFLMSPGKLRLEASLDKEKYYHGEKIAVNVTIDNGTSKKIKGVKISVFQVSDIVLFSKASYKCAVAELESDEGFPIQPSQIGFCKVYTLCPTLESNRDKRGLALDGKLKHEDTNLASSTIIKEASSAKDRENLGIVVQYRVRVRLVMGLLGSSDIGVELPFTLTHPKPDTPPSSRPVSAITNPQDITIETDFIQLKDDPDVSATHDDDIIFEDFARMRLKGVEGDDADA